MNSLPTGRAGQAVRRRPRLHQEDHGLRGAPLLLARQPGQRSQVVNKVKILLRDKMPLTVDFVNFSESKEQSSTAGTLMEPQVILSLSNQTMM